MKTKLPMLRILLAAITAACLAGTAHSQALFYDSFENDTVAIGDLNGKATSDGNASYTVAITSSYFQKRAIDWTETDATVATSLGGNVGRIYQNANATTWVTISTNFDTIDSYVFDIPYIVFTAATNSTGSFSIVANSNINTLRGAFTFTFTSGNSSIGISYVDPDTNMAASIGTITGTKSTRTTSSYYLTDVRIVVKGNTQQLFIGGVAYSSVVATRGIANDGIADQIRLFSKADSVGAFDVQIDNISATAIPEPAATVTLFAAGALVALAICCRMRRS
ncbi:hypothetical protein Ga0100231_012090 [Opitutaceae bacterium TAV4]|nr:hypothetical protein Ga0100231_012090 [Opitutaceae bacterium TAV4]RRK02085.1 hypothetical protein Ga0100230_002445 [Opitutaceae bacterium TAV3]